MRIFKDENQSMESSLLSVEKEFVIQEYDSKYEIPLDKNFSIRSTASIVGDREPLSENFTKVDEQNLKSTITDFLCEIFEKAAEKANHIWRMTQLEGYVPMIGTRTPLLENISVSPKTNELFAEVTKRNKQEYHLHMEIKDRYKDLSVIKGIREKEPIKEILEKQPIQKRPIFDGSIFETEDL